MSNQDWTESEFFKWREALALGALDPPTDEEVSRKQRDITNALSFKFNDDDVDMIVAEKQRFKKNPHNYAARKTQLLKKREMAEMEGKQEDVQQMQEELDQLEERAVELDRRRTSNISSVR